MIPPEARYQRALLTQVEFLLEPLQSGVTGVDSQPPAQGRIGAFPETQFVLGHGKVVIDLGVKSLPHGSLAAQLNAVPVAHIDARQAMAGGIAILVDVIHFGLVIRGPEEAQRTFPILIAKAFQAADEIIPQADAASGYPRIYLLHPQPPRSPSGPTVTPCDTPAPPVARPFGNPAGVPLTRA